MERQELIELLEDKGLLSGEDSFTIVSGREAASIPLHMDHLLILRDCRPEEGKILVKRLLAAYEEDAPLIILGEGNILRVTVREMETRRPSWPETILFDSRKAKVRDASPYDLTALDNTVHRLLAPGGCPWDRSQTHETLRTYFIQEVYEVIDAIDRKDMDNLKEELGDVLFQILFHAALAEKEGFFTMQDVADGVKDKWCDAIPSSLIKRAKTAPFRHPGSGKNVKELKKTGNICFPACPKACQVCF